MSTILNKLKTIKSYMKDFKAINKEEVFLLEKAATIIRKTRLLLVQIVNIV